jgi:hypothetical protein
MPRNSKRIRWRRSARTHHAHYDYLVQSLGTPDDLRAASEFVRNVVSAGALLFLILSKNSFIGAVVEFAAAMALSRVLFRVEGRGRHED